MKKVFLTLAVIVLVINSCKKVEETPSPDEIVINEKTNVLTEQEWTENFLAIDSTNYTLTFKQDFKDKIKEGELIISSQGNGLLRKVKTINATSNQVVVQTEPAYITDVFKQGIIEYSQPLTMGMVKSIDYHYKGIKLVNKNSKGMNPELFEWEINSVLYDFDNNQSTTGDQIRLEGSFSCDWNIGTKIDIGFWEGLKEVKFSFESSENLDLQLIAGLQYSFEKKYTLATVNFTPIVITVGIVPIVFSPQLKIVVGVNGYANASVTSSLEQSLSFNAGIQYLKDKGWAPFTEFEKTLEFQPPQLNANAGVEAYLKPELSIKVYNVAGPYANLKLYAKLDANLFETPWWELYGGLKMNAGAKIDILDKWVLECAIEDILKYEVLLAQASEPPILVPTLTTTSITDITTNSAISGGNITDDGGADVTERGVCWNTSQNPTITNNKTVDGIGTGAFTSNITDLTPYKTYYVRSYATNSAGTAYGNQVSFKTLPVVTIPTVTTSPITSIILSTASGGGNVTSDGYATVTERGICWSTSSNPTISDSRTIDGSGKGTFISNLTNLNLNSTYYVRAYATNSAGTAYGNEVNFTTPAEDHSDPITDIDGNNYETLVIGNQTWMKENLKTTKYNDGSQIANVTVASDWSKLTTGAYCWYNNDVNNKNTYGALYNFYVVENTKNVCPTGWHVPTDTDWTTLTNYLGGLSLAGGKLKESGTAHWLSPNAGATNVSGFTALPGGFINNNGSFNYLGRFGYWWTSSKYNTTNAWRRYMGYDNGNVYRSYTNRSTGYSIRCIKD